MIQHNSIESFEIFETVHVDNSLTGSYDGRTACSRCEVPRYIQQQIHLVVGNDRYVFRDDCQPSLHQFL